MKEELRINGDPNNLLGGNFPISSPNWVDRKKLCCYGMRFLVGEENFVVFLYM